MNRDKLIKYCLTYPSTWEDYPFDNVITTIKHIGNKRIFALIGERDGQLTINLKCDPNKADLLRNLFVGVTTGYHMNKTHWNTVIIESDVPKEELFFMIQESYDLTKSKTKKIQSK